ncbi:hypothetical protein BDV97DRAFT_114282 [Delphinella strobiligena]|nr:hypothetical protein BDV97DRAFT_114282 [Delphinella strobiligena]
MAKHDPVVIDLLSDSEPESNPKPALAPEVAHASHILHASTSIAFTRPPRPKVAHAPPVSHASTSRAPDRSPRPAFVSPRAAHLSGRKAIPDSNYFSSDSSVGNGSDSDIQEITSFNFRKSKNGPLDKTGRTGEESGTATFNFRKSKEGPVSKTVETGVTNGSDTVAVLHDHRQPQESSKSMPTHVQSDVPQARPSEASNNVSGTRVPHGNTLPELPAKPRAPPRDSGDRLNHLLFGKIKLSKKKKKQRYSEMLEFIQNNFLVSDEPDTSEGEYVYEGLKYDDSSMPSNLLMKPKVSRKPRAVAKPPTARKSGGSRPSFRTQVQSVAPAAEPKPASSQTATQSDPRQKVPFVSTEPVSQISAEAQDARPKIPVASSGTISQSETTMQAPRTTPVYGSGAKSQRAVLQPTLVDQRATLSKAAPLPQPNSNTTPRVLDVTPTRYFNPHDTSSNQTAHQATTSTPTTEVKPQQANPQVLDALTMRHSNPQVTGAKQATGQATPVSPVRLKAPQAIPQAPVAPMYHSKPQVIGLKQATVQAKSAETKARQTSQLAPASTVASQSASQSRRLSTLLAMSGLETHIAASSGSIAHQEKRKAPNDGRADTSSGTAKRPRLTEASSSVAPLQIESSHGGASPHAQEANQKAGKKVTAPTDGRPVVPEFGQWVQDTEPETSTRAVPMAGQKSAKATASAVVPSVRQSIEHGVSKEANTADEPPGGVHVANMARGTSSNMVHHKQPAVSAASTTISQAQPKLPLADIKPRPFAAKGRVFTPADDQLIIYLREVEHVPWSHISHWFPGRKWAGLQSRYSMKLSRLKREQVGGQPSPPSTNATTRPRRLHANEAPASGVAPLGIAMSRPRRSVVTGDIMKIATPDTDSATEIAARPHRRLTRRTDGPFNQVTLAENSDPVPEPSAHQHELKQLFGQLRQPPFKYPCGRNLRSRELGLTGARTNPRMLQSNITDYAYSTLGPVRYMNDASGDVCTVAWSPRGNLFAAGAIAVIDPDSMQYNKPRNLVIADAVNGDVKELPHHKLPRPAVETGANASNAMRSSQDPHIFTTVQSVAFAANGRRMYSVSMDNHLNVYKVHDNIFRTKLTGRSQQDAPVELLSVSKSGPVATGCRHSGPGSIAVLSRKGKTQMNLSASRVTTSMKKYPSALRFGESRHHSHLLLAGFSCEAERIYEEDDVYDKEGETCLWDVNTGQSIELGAMNRNVFDLSWNPHPSITSTSFAVASGVGRLGKVNHGMHSIIRLYAPSQTRAKFVLELECPAWDINDVIYSPLDDNLIAAGSTDGKVYIWDLRRIKNDQGPLRVLEHGDSLSVLPHEKKRWEADTGIRFLSWGTDHTRLYSGSSDGVVKCWNPYRSDEDKHVRDVVKFQSAIMSGAFSPNHEDLLIGEDASRLNMLSIGNEDKTVKDMKSFRVQKEPEPAEPYAASRELLQSGQIELRPMGAMPIRQAVQGPDYDGPYLLDATLRHNATLFQRKAAQSYMKQQEFIAQTGRQSPCGLDCAHYHDSAVAQVEISAADDSGRFFDRIPGNLHHPTDSGLKALMRGLNAKCHKCGAVARAADDGEEAKALCEKCNFSCFRCSMPVHISSRMRVVECENCRLTWRMGVLGYELIEEVVSGSSANAVETGDAMNGVGVEIEPKIWDLGGEETSRHFGSAAA